MPFKPRISQFGTSYVRQTGKSPCKQRTNFSLHQPTMCPGGAPEDILLDKGAFGARSECIFFNGEWGRCKGMSATHKRIFFTATIFLQFQRKRFRLRPKFGALTVERKTFPWGIPSLVSPTYAPPSSNSSVSTGIASVLTASMTGIRC